MFDLEEFEENLVLKPIIDKFNKFLAKNKTEKLSKLIDQLINLLEDEEQVIPVSYALSVVAEHRFDLLPPQTVKIIGDHLNSPDTKLRINSLIFIGFAMISDSKISDKYFEVFLDFLIDESQDVRDNSHYFVSELHQSKEESICLKREIILKALELEENIENLTSLIRYLDTCKNFSFRELYSIRELSKLFLQKYHNNDLLLTELQKFNALIFSSMNDLDYKKSDLNGLLDSLDQHFIMKKHDFNKIHKEQEIRLKDFMDDIKSNAVKDVELFFYVQSKQNNKIFVYELEKEKLLRFFERDSRISGEEISVHFSQIIHSKSEIRTFIQTLVRLNHINGYFSELGYYYPHDYLKREMHDEILKTGSLELKKYNYLPPKLISTIVKEISTLKKLDLLLGKNKQIYFSLSKIQNQINIEAAKSSSIDLKEYRESLTDRSFLKLIKNLPKDYLTNFHKGTHWLTNLGLTRIKNDIENSKIIGFFSIPQVADKLNMNQVLLLEVLEQIIDFRSGIFDKNNEVFYYSKYLKNLIENLNQFTDVEREEEVNRLAMKLNIDRDHIISKIDENIKLIGEEIKQQEQISLEEYLDKTGMSSEVFFEFINELGLRYLRRGNSLIFNETKINEAKNSIKSTLIEKARSVDYISLGDLDVTSKIVEDLLVELQNDQKITGVFYNDHGEILYYTEIGIENLMLQNSSIFSFDDLFTGKDLKPSELDLLNSVFNNLIKKGRLKGRFDEETHTFFSNDVLFAQDYNSVLDEFKKIITKYFQLFEFEFEKIKKILTKRSETIYPQEIIIVQKSIDKTNTECIRWRNNIEAYTRNANVKVLKKQGYSIKKYKSMDLSAKTKEEIKFFEEDLEVLELMDIFNAWVKKFNDLELKCGNILFYQKRHINEPDNEQVKEKLDELLIELKLVDVK